MSEYSDADFAITVYCNYVRSDLSIPRTENICEYIIQIYTAGVVNCVMCRFCIPFTGKVELTKVIEIQKHKGSRHGFNHVIHMVTPKRTYVLCAETPEEKEEWFSTLKSYIAPSKEV